MDDVRRLSSTQRQMHASQCFAIASAQSASKMCVTLGACTHQAARSAARQGKIENYEMGRGEIAAYLNGQRNSREAENTVNAKEYR